MIRDPSDLTTLMTSGSDPEEVIARRAVFHLSLNDLFGIPVLWTKWTPDLALNLIFLKEYAFCDLNFLLSNLLTHPLFSPLLNKNKCWSNLKNV